MLSILRNCSRTHARVRVCVRARARINFIEKLQTLPFPLETLQIFILKAQLNQPEGIK